MAKAGISPKELQELKAKTEKEIEEIRTTYCANCEEPATGPDRCDTSCEHGLRLQDRYWLLRMMEH